MFKDNYICEQVLPTGKELYKWTLNNIDTRSIPRLQINNEFKCIIPLNQTPHSIGPQDPQNNLSRKSPSPISQGTPMSDIYEMDQELNRILSEQALTNYHPSYQLMNYPLPVRATTPEYPDILSEASKKTTKELSDTVWKTVDEIGHTNDFILQDIHFKDLWKVLGRIKKILFLKLI